MGFWDPPKQNTICYTTSQMLRRQTHSAVPTPNARNPQLPVHKTHAPPNSNTASPSLKTPAIQPSSLQFQGVTVLRKPSKEQ